MSESAAEPVEDAQAEQMLADAATASDGEPVAEEKVEQPPKPATGPSGFPPNTPVAQMSLDEREAYWKFNSRKWEKDAKQNAEAARKYAEFEESQKTEQQRLADRLAAAEQRATQAEIGRARLVAAAAHGIPSSLLDRIGGSSEEEINESAQALASEIDEEVARRIAAMPAPPVPDPPAPTPSTYRPVEALTPGAMPANGEPVDGNEFLRRMAGR